MTGFSHVLFDLDGTLTDSESGIVASYRHTLDAFGLTAAAAEIRRAIGPPLPDSLAGLGVPPADIDAAVAVYREYFARAGIFDNRLYPGIAGMLTALIGEGLELAVATSKLEHFAIAILDHFGIADHFAVIAGSSPDGQRRHKEDVVAHALESFGWPDPAGVAMVGDREHDIFAARHHGLHPIGVTWGYGSEGELIAAGAVIMVASAGALRAVLADSDETAPSYQMKMS